MFRVAAFFLAAFIFSALRIHGNLQRDDYIDVLKYKINIEVNDTTNLINGSTGITIVLKKPAHQIELDLVSRNSSNTGMVVDSVLKGGVQIRYNHTGNRLHLPVPENISSDTLFYKIFYQGIPADGLIMSKNMYGRRTFFADNWPDRARNWFPSFDHPSDRAIVDFVITAPSHYQVIATGLLQRKVNIPGKRTTHYWSTSVPIPTKVMVFGAAEFAVEYHEDINNIPFSTWVYPENLDEGLHDFSVTPEIVNFFSEMLGPYPFEKLANVQSTTRYGGMENAGNIFYHEGSITGNGSLKSTIVHEIAHQWFGNSVTERDWPHLWLSEGLATWLTDYYYEQQICDSIARERFISHRNRIIDFSKTRLAPVVDFHEEKYTELLNPNTYQKGSWILHMLRQKIGEKALVEGIVEFYNRHQLSHACSDDFIRLLEEITGENLEQFFDDWLFSAGHPQLSFNTSFSNNRFRMEVVQIQQHKMAFTFPLDIRFICENDKVIDHTFDIMFRRHEFILDLPSEPVDIIYDPDVWLLFELMNP